MDAKFRSIAEAVMLLGLVIFGTMALTPDKAHGCEARGIAMNCEKVSGSRCYFEKEDGSTSYKVCREGWVKLSNLVIQQELIFVDPNLSPSITGDFTTSPDGRICYAQGNLRRGAPCAS